MYHDIVSLSNQETVMKRKESGASRWALVGLAVILGSVLAYALLWLKHEPVHAPLKRIEAGMSAPDFGLSSAQGDAYHLAKLKGQVILLSFINSRPLDASLSTPDVSRNQIVFLKSVAQQYASRGVQVLLVDATALAGGEQPDQEALLNFAHNWDMETIPVLMNSETTVREYGISQVPTTLLIAPDGRVTHRWEGFASAAQLAFAVQALVGLPDSSPYPAPTPSSIQEGVNQ